MSESHADVAIDALKVVLRQNRQLETRIAELVRRLLIEASDLDHYANVSGSQVGARIRFIVGSEATPAPGSSESQP